ncbi:MAG: M15 family metallopeptidase [Actinobacteria bacterium]|nr:M15 family metallopeptidase [Actinomycetota bacterium]
MTARHRWWTIPLAVLGIVAGAMVTLAAQPEPTPVEVPSATPPAAVPATPVKIDSGVLLVWSAGGLPQGLDQSVEAIDQVRAVTVVHGDRVDLASSTDVDGQPVDTADDGWAWPLDALAVDPAGYARFAPKGASNAIAELGEGQAVLGSTSAGIRRLTAGGRMTLTDGAELEVTAVVDDTAVAAAELVVDLETGERIGVTTPRFLLVAYDGDRASLEDAVRQRVPEGVNVRIRVPAETPYLRHGDAVLPQALVKERFGEFSYRPPEGDGQVFAQDPEWETAHIVSVDLPVLGSARCHRAVVESLRGALTELEDEGLGHLVDADGFAGCHNPRLIAPGDAVSRHAWGVAVDLNAGVNPTGTGSSQDQRLVETFTRWGFTWGGFWLIPDPMHFEYLRAPDTGHAG